MRDFRLVFSGDGYGYGDPHWKIEMEIELRVCVLCTLQDDIIKHNKFVILTPFSHSRWRQRAKPYLNFIREQGARRWLKLGGIYKYNPIILIYSFS